jgi:hypothetical protein
MTSGDLRPAADEASVVAYEELRNHVLRGAPGNGAGLGLLLREGLAAWLEGRGASSPRCEPEATLRPTPRATSPLVSDEIQAGIVGVLASMVLAA